MAFLRFLGSRTADQSVVGNIDRPAAASGETEAIRRIVVQRIARGLLLPCYRLRCSRTAERARRTGLTCERSP